MAHDKIQKLEIPRESQALIIQSQRKDISGLKAENADLNTQIEEMKDAARAVGFVFKHKEDDATIVDSDESDADSMAAQYSDATIVGEAGVMLGASSTSE